MIDAISARLGLGISRIGRVCNGNDVVVLDDNGQVINLVVKGHDHFG